MSKISKALKKFPGVFWVANTMELFERWAWYGLFAVLALYLTQSTDTGALGFSQTQKGDIMGIVTAILYLLPIVTGAIADRFGYKKVLILAYIVLSSGYFMMGKFTTYGYVFFAFLYVALGAAMFKPIVSATVAKTTDKDTSSIGFGIFYMMVNIGGFLGPIVSSKMRVVAWDHVFTMSTVSILVNLVLVLLFYKEPKRETEVETKKYLILDYLNIFWTLITSIIIFVVFFTIFLSIFILESFVVFLLKERFSFKFVDFINTLPIGEDNKKIFRNITTIFRDSKFILFLVFIVGFWTMFNQIFYTLPNFIDQWVNTKPLFDFFQNIWSGLTWFFGPNDGRKVIEPEIVVSFDSGFIILFQIIVSSIVMRLRPINSMISGIIVSAIGVGLAFATHSVGFVVLGILIFALGEMASSPKFTEYIGLIAPRDKVGLYMGYSFLPVAIGNLLAGFLSGRVYQTMSDKISLLQIEAAKRGLHIQAISKATDFTQNDYIDQFCKLTGMNHAQVTEFLWKHYHPANIWMVFAVIGFIAVAGLWIYDRFILKSKQQAQA
ncbi:MAG: MFS transporter [Bacteroidales bacterium]|nr:MFS transporter [Bacteroidales bacterium]